MKRAFGLTFLVLLMIFFAACGGAAEPTGEEAASGSGSSNPAADGSQTIVIGYTASQTGKQNVSSTRQVNGLNLWMEAINEAGGIKLSNGTAVTFDSVTYDDESNTDRVQELYTRLATEDNADF